MLKGTKTISALAVASCFAGALFGCSDPATQPLQINDGSTSDPTNPGPGATDPNTGLPINPPPNPTPGATDPNTGLPVNPPPNPTPGATDPNTGLPVNPTPNPTPGATDPNTGLPVNPTPTDPVPNPVGNGGAPVNPNPTPVGEGGTGNTPVNPDPNPTTVTGGYYVSKEWHGCSWTGKDTFGQTSLEPQDFVALSPGEPFCIAGSVAPEPEYRGVALLGFNVNEPEGSDCTYTPVDPNADGPPSVTPLDNGIAVDFVKRGADTSFNLRVQIQGPDGHRDGDAGANDRWCANITEVQGKVFIPYSEFNTQCWFVNEDGTTTADYTGAWYANQPISAVVFTVPGDDDTAIPYDFCVNGWAYGTSAADAPDGTAVGGPQSGTIGEGNDFDRVKVNVGGENYIIQNNNWGNPEGSEAVLSYSDNSFTVVTATGSNSPAPASFPSIYIGANGNTQGGVYSTTSTDNLPIQISAINSINTTFTWGGFNGTFNATYDVWFANSPPNAEYQDGIDGFVMVWLYRPGNQQPIGSVQRQATIAGQNWEVWVGPRGDGPAGYNDAPVVSYVATSTLNTLTFDLLDFIQDASANGIGSSMYLTDVFAGFEIWNGGQGLSVEDFSIDVVPN